MRTVVLKYGLISGGIIILFMIANTTMMKGGSADMGSSEVLGYAGMLIALTMVFIGVKSYRDKHQNGLIRFGKALTVGLLIALVASVVYVASWEIYYQSDEEVRETFMPRYIEHTMKKMKEQGASEEEMQKQRSQMEEMATMYKQAPFRLAITLVEILPIGIVVALVSAAILRRKEVLPAGA